MKIIRKFKCVFCSPLLKGFAVTTICYSLVFLIAVPTQVGFELKKKSINDKIEKIINESCPETFMTWTILDQKPFMDQYVFGDVVGCLKKEKNCAQSVKKFNKYWQESHEVDADSYNYLYSFNNDEIRYVSNIESLKNKKSVYEAIKASNWQVIDIYLMTVKGKLFVDGMVKKVLYVISLEHTVKTENFCHPEVIKNKLQELYIEARK